MKLNLSNRAHKQIAAACVASLLIGLVSGYAASNGESEPTATETGRFGVVCILPDTGLRMEIRYQVCGHTEYRTLDKPEWIGKTKEELIALCPEDSIASFSANEVCLVRLVDAYCAGHLQLKSNATGTLTVYRTNADTEQNEMVLTLPMGILDLSPTAQEDVKNGLLFDSMEGINAYLESMES